MSHYCPLCGKEKDKDTLFCDDCRKKVEKEYEVDVPKKEEIGSEEVKKSEEKSIQQAEKVTEEFLETKEETKLTEAKTDTEVSKEEGDAEIAESKVSRKAINKLSRTAVIVFAIVAALTGFYFYGGNVRKNNLDKLRWDAAQKENTVTGYITYMVEFPKGKYYDMAEQGVMLLKDMETGKWNDLQVSENSAELRDFLRSNQNSAYKPLIQKRLDSLEWISALNDNSAESYARYREMVNRGDFSGDYIHDAEKRHNLLRQTYPVVQAEMDSLKQLSDRFFTALSSLDADKMGEILAPRVFEFFGPGGTKEKIVGELLISGSKTQSPTISFIPDLSGMTYEKTQIEHYKVNLPVQKSFVNDNGFRETLTGYIVSMEVDRNFHLITVSENEPRRR